MTLEKVIDESLAKVIEFLLENPVLDYSKKQLAEESGVSRTTLYRMWNGLEELRIIEKTRKFQNTQLYKLNVNSPIVNELGRLKIRLEEELKVPSKIPV